MIGKSIVQWMKSEIILIIAALAAIISSFFVPVSFVYLDYIDVRTLCLLFCLMIIIAGIQKCGVFDSLAQSLLSGNRSLRLLQIILILVPFFASMLITNDVALITFVPFTISILQMAQEQKKIILILVLQTIAANLGSMATPIGNPQNIYLCGFFQMDMTDFFITMLPSTILSFVILGCFSIVCRNKNIQIHFPKKLSIQNKNKLKAFVLLFVLCIFTVFHVLSHWLLLGVVCITIFLIDKELFKRVDYILLLTFVFFFIFAGNMSNLETVRQILQSFMEKSALLTSMVASQIFSNVPAAILLSNFTDNVHELLLGVNIGGLGTPIASLASLITIKYYLKSEYVQPKKFFLYFLCLNFFILILLYVFVLMF